MKPTHLPVRVRHTAFVMLCFLVPGCSAIKEGRMPFTSPPPVYQTDNVFGPDPTLPGDIKRIALLPLTCDGHRLEIGDARKDLEPILNSELLKTKRFEVVTIDPQALLDQTGRLEWTDTEPLPRDFFATLQKDYGCDAVLFCRLTEFRAYPPLAIGWRMRLVTTAGRQTLWAGDEVYDAGKQTVRTGAIQYEQQEEASGTAWTILNSPRKFGQYSIAQLLGTLPER